MRPVARIEASIVKPDDYTLAPIRRPGEGGQGTEVRIGNGLQAGPSSVVWEEWRSYVRNNFRFAQSTHRNRCLKCDRSYCCSAQQAVDFPVKPKTIRRHCERVQ